MKHLKLFIFISVIVFSFQSCDKDNDDKIEETTSTQRIKQIVNYNEFGEQTSKTDFVYVNDLLTKTTTFYKDAGDNWYEYTIKSITYDGDNATTIRERYDLDTGSWSYISKNTYTISEGLMLEEMSLYYLDGTWFPSWKWNYQYSNKKLIAWQSYDQHLTLEGKGVYTYSGAKLTEYQEEGLNELGVLFPSSKQTFSYMGEDMSGWVYYNIQEESYDWIESYKCAYTYNEVSISNAQYWSWSSETENWESDSSISYSYDADENLSEISTSWGNRTTYLYEEGSGNAKLFHYYPEEIVNGAPTLKSVTKELQYMPYYKRFNQTW